MTGSIERILEDFAQFQRNVEDCRSAGTFRPEQWRDAYSALGRLRDRVECEKEHLSPVQRAALRKVFEDDSFIEGMMATRVISEHVVKREGPADIRTTENAPLIVEASAGEMFGSMAVTLVDTNGLLQKIDHLARLDEAEGRIKRAVDKALEVKGTAPNHPAHGATNQRIRD